MTSIDLERKNSLVSEGVHTFKIASSEEKGPGASGFMYWNFRMTCIDKGPDEGQAVWTMLSLSPQARFKLDQFLDAVEAPQSGTVSHENFVGKTLRAKIQWQDYEGSPKAVVETYIVPGAAVPANNGNGTPKTPANPAPGGLPKDTTNSGFKPPF